MEVVQFERGASVRPGEESAHGGLDGRRWDRGENTLHVVVAVAHSDLHAPEPVQVIA
jgi:hypothetical protein